MHADNTAGHNSDVNISRLHKSLLIFIALLVYMTVFRDGLTILKMPDLDDRIVKMQVLETGSVSWIELSNGKKYSVPDRLASLLSRGMTIKHRGGSFYSEVDGRQVRIFKIMPLIMLAVAFILWLLASQNHPSMLALAEFLFADRKFFVCYAYLIFPVVAIYAVMTRL